MSATAHPTAHAVAHATASAPAAAGRLPTLIVFSHLRWGFVFQRPQHLLTRLAGRWRVVFVEEPVHADGAPRLEVQRHGEHLQVLVPHTAVAAPGFHDDQIALLQGLLSSWLRTEELQPDVAWLYTPMALPLVRTVQPACVVYDCMDELTGFWGAPRQLRQRESALMRVAVLVLTGGPSLYEARRDAHPQVVCIPSSVDAWHFAPSRLAADAEHARQAAALQAHIDGPRLGFYGVIDERLDLALVRQLAQADPEWQLVMVGPVVKIDPQSLPRAPNIHWLSIQPYALLPHLLAGWDLALMPFAINAATRFISPTKTLEYLAGDKPVVSTPVHDVVQLYGHAVTVAPAGEAFIAACVATLAESARQRRRRQAAMAATVATQSWGRAADSIHDLLLAALSQADAPADAQADTSADAPADAPADAQAGRDRERATPSRADANANADAA